MMQLGNLAIVAANHKDCRLQIYNNEVTVQNRQETERKNNLLRCKRQRLY